MSFANIRFGDAVYKVPDLGAAKQFYSKAFGLDTYFDEPGRVVFKVWRYELWLVPADSTEDRPEAPKILGKPGELRFWSVMHIETVYQRFVELAATVRRPLRKDGPIFMRAIVEDPWGNIIGLHNHPW